MTTRINTSTNLISSARTMPLIASLKVAALLMTAAVVAYPMLAGAQTLANGKSLGPTAKDVPPWMITQVPDLPASVSPDVTRISLTQAGAAIEGADLAIAVASEAAALHDPKKTAAALDVALKVLTDFAVAQRSVAEIAEGKLQEAVADSRKFKTVPLFLTSNSTGAGNTEAASSADRLALITHPQNDAKTLSERLDVARRTVTALQVLFADALERIEAPGSPGERASMADGKLRITLAQAVARDALARRQVEDALAAHQASQAKEEMKQIRQEEKAGTMTDPKMLAAYRTTS